MSDQVVYEGAYCKNRNEVSKKENREKSEENIKDGKYNVSAKDSETLIDPNIRWEFLKALRCKLPKDKDLVNDNKINPFYNYEFFVIEGKNDNDIEKQLKQMNVCMIIQIQFHLKKVLLLGENVMKMIHGQDLV